MIKRLIKQIVSKKEENNKPHLSIDNTPYALMGENQVKELAHCFYDVMEADPKVEKLLALHPQPMDKIRQKFYEFLSGWTGGPDLFIEKYGHPRLRARHLPFPIDKELRDQWMYCMNIALDKTVTNQQVKTHLQQAFSQMATHMINK